MEKQYNIMTSCDDNLVPYLAIELTSMAYNLKASCIEFFSYIAAVSVKLM